MSVKDAFRSGDDRRALEALRDRIAEEIDGVECCRCNLPRRAAGSETSALTLRLMQVDDALKNLPEEGEESFLDRIRGEVDELAERRERADAPEKGTKNAPRRQSTRRRDKARDGA